MSYVGSRYLVIGSAAPGYTFVLECGAAECSSLYFTYPVMSGNCFLMLYLFDQDPKINIGLQICQI